MLCTSCRVFSVVLSVPLVPDNVVTRRGGFPKAFHASAWIIRQFCRFRTAVRRASEIWHDGTFVLTRFGRVYDETEPDLHASTACLRAKGDSQKAMQRRTKT